MAAQKSKQPAAKPDNDSSGSESDDSESDNTGPNSHIVKKPESLQDEDEDGSSESESDDIRPSKTVTKVPQPSQTVAKAPGKASTLKRPRCDDEGGPTENARPIKRITKESETQLFHESYIESSGDCTILAGKTYFKIPRVLLTRPSKYFQEILAGVRHERDGRVSPIRACAINDMFDHELQESPEDVGALYWLLTAYPNEVIEQGDPSKGDLTRLISILYMTNKYQFPEHEEWAKSQLLRYFTSSHGGELKQTNPTSSANYKRLYALASSIWLRFRSSIRTKWLSDLDDHKEVLDFAESMNDRILQAYVYYNELLRMKGGRQDKWISPAPPFHENNFTPTQNMCLYRGFWSLSQTWKGIRTPELKTGTSKDHRENCIKHWAWMWEQGAGTLGGDSFGDSASQEQAVIFDPLGALDRLIALPPHASTSGDTERCGCRFQGLAKSVRNRLRKELADHFLGPVLGNASQ